jgi:hypothetical protein
MPVIVREAKLAAENAVGAGLSDQARVCDILPGSSRQALTSGRITWACCPEIILSGKGKQPPKGKGAAVGAIELPKPRPSRASVPNVSIREVSQIIQKLVETFGWPGTVLVLGFWFFQVNATPDQKQRVIEMLISGTGISWAIAALSATFILVVLAQHHWYNRRVAILKRRLEEVAGEKSRLQEQQSGKQLRHGENFKPEED